MDFSGPWNLVRDQEVGGSNPLAPTTLFRINDLYHTRVTRNSEARLVGNQAFLSHIYWTLALLALWVHGLAMGGSLY
jgi:hypothetical protein